MKPEPGISVVLLRSLAQSVRRIGGDPDAFLGGLGVDDSTSIDAYVPGSQVVGALERLSGGGRSGGGFALSLARASPVGSLGFFDYLFVASSNLREALSRSVRFYGLMSQLVSLVIEEGDDGWARVFHKIDPHAARVPALTEFAFASFVARAREAIGDRLGLQTVRFTHKVSDPQSFEAFFRVRVAFGDSIDELRFDAKALDMPFPSADPTTVAFLEAHAARMKAKLGLVDSFRDRVRAAIAQGLRNRACDVASLARALHLSSRTLQRELLAHGTSHRELVADVRREIAMDLLARENTSVVEVAYELGFTQQAAFHRAFARWTGMTPGVYRTRRASRR